MTLDNKPIATGGLYNHVELKDIYLFTHTAESLYKRLAWQQLERLALGGKDIVVMKKEL